MDLTFPESRRNIRLNLRDLQVRDVEQVVGIHYASFPNHFLTFLGRRFLYLYYEGIAESEYGIAIIAEMHGEIVGFVTGFADPRKFYAQLLRRGWFKFALSSLGAVARRPRVIFKLLRAFSLPGASPAGSDQAMLSSLATLSDFRGMGIGRGLVERFLSRSKELGVAAITLGTRKSDGETVAFYRKLGFTLAREVPEPEGDIAYEFIYKLGGSG